MKVEMEIITSSSHTGYSKTTRLSLITSEYLPASSRERPERWLVLVFAKCVPLCSALHINFNMITSIFLCAPKPFWLDQVISVCQTGSWVRASVRGRKPRCCGHCRVHMRENGKKARCHHHGFWNELRSFICASYATAFHIRLKAS